MKPTTLATQTAHLIGPGKIKILNGRLAFSTGQGTPTKLDPARLQQLLCSGDVGISDEAFHVLFQHGVEVAWLSPRGSRFRGRLANLADSSTALRMLQHRVLGDAARKLALAQAVVAEKMDSQVQAARHFQRHGVREAAEFLRRVAEYRRQLADAAGLDVVRGLEGVASKEWFQLWGGQLATPWTFPGRVRRPPTDPVNALLSLGYTWLTNKMIARISAAGLEVQIGALHEYLAGRPSLACDLIEALRVPVVDRWVLKLLNGGSVRVDHFESSAAQGTRLTRDGFPQVLTHWEQDWQQHRHGALVEGQVLRFAADLRANDGQGTKD